MNTGILLDIGLCRLQSVWPATLMTLMLYCFVSSLKNQLYSIRSQYTHTVTGLQFRIPRNRGSIPRSVKRSNFLWGPPASRSVGTCGGGALFLRIKRREREAEHLSLFVADVENYWPHTSTRLIRLRGLHRDFTWTLCPIVCGLK